MNVLLSSALDALIFGVKSFITLYGVLWFKEYLDERTKQKDLKKNNMDSEYNRSSQVTSILDEIKHELGCDRVLESAFSNGDVTFSGIHMKKVSIINEAQHPDPLAPHFQLVPVKQFKRTMDALYNSETDYCIFHEDKQGDALSSLHKRFKMTTIMAAKVRDDQGRWIGMLTAVWSEEKYDFTPSQIAYLQMQAAVIGGIKY